METNNEGEEGPLALKPMMLFIFVFYFMACKEKTTTNSRPLLNQTSKDSASKFEKQLTKKTLKKKKTIYLTFDDGPNKGSANVLSVIQDDSIPASLFIIGQHVYGSAAQMEIWHSMQHCPWVEICNHSYTHAHNRYAKFYTNDSLVVNDFFRCRDSLHLKNLIARTPGRNIWRWGIISSTDVKASKKAADSLQSAGFELMGWDLEWQYTNRFALKKSPEELMKDIDSAFIYKKTKTPDHLVLLAHDQVFDDSTDLASLKTFIKSLKEKNEYELDVVSNYPKSLAKQ